MYPQGHTALLMWLNQSQNLVRRSFLLDDDISAQSRAGVHQGTAKQPILGDEYQDPSTDQEEPIQREDIHADNLP